MKVTLFQNCKLNNKYKDVFYNKTYLETYLGTLTKKVVLEDSYIFSRETDNLYIDDTNIADFKQYNYMKIEDSIGTFYAFINNIKWINDIYQIFYEEDIMSNWFEYVHIRNSLLTGNKSLKLYKGTAQKNISLFSYNVEPKSNDALTFDAYNVLDNPNGTNLQGEQLYSPKVGVIVKLQLYKLDQAGNPTDRKLIIGSIETTDLNDGNPSYNLWSRGANSNLSIFIQTLINKRGTTTISFETISGYYYDIDKIYAMPENLVHRIGYINPHVYQSNYLFTVGNYKFWINDLRPVDSFLPSYVYEKTITYDRKIDSIGLFTSPIKIANNGTNINIKIETYISYYGLSVILNMQNKMIDITNKFIVDLPFTQASSSELQLQRLQLNLQENSFNNKIDNTNQEYQANIAKLAVGATFGTVGAIGNVVAGNTLSAFSSLGSTLSGIAEYGSNIEKAKNDIKYTEERINLINQKMYCSSSILTNKFSFINALFGLCVFKINEDNTTQVNQAVALSGYLVRELVGDVIQQLDIENLTDHYDVFKFDEVNLYGVIAQDYIRVIENILLNGVRVWCQGAIGELV